MSATDTVKRVYTKFVLDLCELISEDEKFKVIKYAEGKLGQELQLTLTCAEVFEKLNEKLGLHKASSLAVFKDICFILKREDLIKLSIDYQASLAKAWQEDIESVHSDKDDVKVTIRFPFSSLTECSVLVKELVVKISDLVFAPVDHVRVTLIEELTQRGSFCVLILNKLYADILQNFLQDADTGYGWQYLGITSIIINNITYEMKDKLVPVEILQEHREIISTLSKQNEKFLQRLDRLGKSLESLQPLISELGDPMTHVKKLEKLHQHSGLSTTFWKTVGRLRDDQLPQEYTPDFSQDEIRQRCLYSKARMQRMYPQLCEK